MTVGELKKILSEVDDNTKIVTTSKNFELRDSIVDDVGVFEKNVKVEKRQFSDSFDRTRYSMNIYVMDKDGEKVVYIG